MLSGTMGSETVTGRLRGADITFDIGKVKYSGHVSGTTMSGTMSGSRTGNWTATKNK